MPHRHKLNYWLSIIGNGLFCSYLVMTWGWTAESIAVSCLLSVALSIYWGMQPERDGDE